MNPPTWAKNATAPPFALALNSPESASSEPKTPGGRSRGRAGLATGVLTAS